MVHDADLVERLEAFPSEQLDYEAFRATRMSLDPLAGSYNGGRWMPRDTVAVLYTSLESEGALSEIAFHYSHYTPMPTKPILVHRLRIKTQRTVRLDAAAIQDLGVPALEYPVINHPRTQEIGAAVEFLGFDGLIAPSARWPCENLMLFTEQSHVELQLLGQERLEWIPWARAHGFLE